MKTMKSTMARLFALCLTVAMVLSMATMGAFATNVAIGQTGTITINSAASDNKAKVDLYKIIDVNMVNVGTEEEPVFQLQDPVYIWVDAVATWLETNANATYKGYINASNNAITDSFKKATAGQLSNFFHDMKTAMEPKKDGTVELELTAAKSTTISGTTEEITGVEMGQYLVIAEKSAYVYSPATVTLAPVWDQKTGEWVAEDAAVTVKGRGGIDKNVEGENGDNSDNSDLGYAVGDTVTYRLDVVIPDYPKDATATAFNVGDKMSHGLTWDKKVAVYWSENGIMHTKKEGEGDDQKEVPDPDYLVDASNYALATPEDDPELAKDKITFEVRFDYKNLIKNCSGAKYVHVVYNATLNEDAFEEDALGNDAYLGVNTDPYDGGSYETTDTHEQVYTYGMTVTKVDANDLVALPGAEFKLYSDDTCTKEIKFVGSDGVYTKALDQESAGVTLETNGLGQITLGGLDVGTYYLKEVKAPNGYQLPNDTDAVTSFTMTDTTGGTPSGADGKLDSGTATGSMLEGSATFDGNTISFTIGNTKPGFELPTTGGMGTVLFTAGGLVIMACGAALVLVTLKKKKAED